MSEVVLPVTLKLKVSNRKSGLLEWRPCECVITNDLRVELKPSLAADSDDEGGDDHDDSPASTVITIDLATQLQHIEQKKKNRARCELVFASETSGRASEELMAPSAKICQQWVDRVREALQIARRQVSIRQGATAANACAASVSSLPRDISIANGLNGHHQPVLQTSATSSSTCQPAISHDSVVDDGLVVASTLGDPVEGGNSSSKAMEASAASNSSISSSAISYTLQPTAAAQLDTRALQRQHRGFQSDSGTGSSQPFLKASNTSTSSSRPEIQRVDLSASTLSSCSSSSSESSIMDASYSARFQPTRPRSSQLKSRGDSRGDYRYTVGNNDDEEDEEEDELSRLSPRSRARVAAALRRQRIRLDQRQIERSRGYTSPPRHLHEHQYDPPSHRLSRSSRRRRGSFTAPLSARSPSIGTGLTDSFDAVHLSSIALDNEHCHSNQKDLADSRRHHEDGDDSSRQELRMLLRVEEALRHLEHENAQRKQREEALASQVQSLKDALRVKSAEREHVASEFRAALHAKEKWQQAAQNAERMAGQLREELAIAREETQLLARDKLRLKRQNGELLAQVHRLDSLVYGRF